MTQPIVIAFDADGTAEWTRNSRFVPFGGEGTMQRVTDIRKVPDKPRYYIHWMLGPYKGSDHTAALSVKLGCLDRTSYMTINMVLLFGSYEAAVQHEIQLLNAMRRNGVSFHE